MNRFVALLFMCISLNVSAGEAITHLSNIYRAPVESEINAMAGFGQYYTFSSPSYISGMGNYIFFSEFNSTKVYRYNTGSEQVKIFSNISSHITGNITCLSVQPDLSFFVCDPMGNKVILFNPRGEVRQEFSSFGNLANPIGAALAPSMDTVLITDSLYDHIIAFSPLGLPLSSFGSRGTEHDSVLNIQDTATDHDSFYVMGKLNKYVKKFSFDGEFLESFDRSDVIMPTALAVDVFGRSYIADDYDNTIKVFSYGKLVQTIGGDGTADSQFLSITDMLVLGSLLYVVDSNNHRIQVFVINPVEGN